MHNSMHEKGHSITIKSVKLRPKENPNSQNLSNACSPARPGEAGKLWGFQSTAVGHFRGSGALDREVRVAGGASGKLRTTEEGRRRAAVV